MRARERAPGSDSDPSEGISVLKEQSGTRVELSGRGRTVRKTFRVPAHLRWRTFGLASRAEREAENLGRLREAGIPAVRPVDWSESRTLGFVTECTLETEFIEARPLEELLRDDQAPEVRLSVITRCGHLLRQLHEAGFLCLSLQLRNVLVDAELELHILDQPRLLAYPRSLLGTRPALIDLWDAAYSEGRRGYLSSDEVRSLVLAYCAGDPARGDAIDRGLRSRSPRVQRLEKLWAAGLAQLRGIIAGPRGIDD